MILPTIARMFRLSITLAACGLRRLRLRGPLTFQQRAEWLHGSCKSVLSALGVQCFVHGRPPSSGLLVANHLSYLDILVLGAATPCIFISKAEVLSWPIFGVFARASGTLFLDRASRASALCVARFVKERLVSPIPIVFFPEGTSTDGSTVLDFHPWLFEPAVQTGSPVTPSALSYAAQQKAERELCWFGDATMLPHLLRLLGSVSITVHLCFAESRIFTERHTAAEETRRAVIGMRNHMLHVCPGSTTSAPACLST